MENKNIEDKKFLKIIEKFFINTGTVDTTLQVVKDAELIADKLNTRYELLKKYPVDSVNFLDTYSVYKDLEYLRYLINFDSDFLKNKIDSNIKYILDNFNLTYLKSKPEYEKEIIKINNELIKNQSIPGSSFTFLISDYLDLYTGLIYSYITAILNDSIYDYFKHINNHINNHINMLIELDLNTYFNYIDNYNLKLNNITNDINYYLNYFSAVLELLRNIESTIEEVKPIEISNDDNNIQMLNAYKVVYNTPELALITEIYEKYSRLTENISINIIIFGFVYEWKEVINKYLILLDYKIYSNFRTWR